MIHPSAAAVGLDLVIHDQADLALEITGNLDDQGVFAADEIHAESRAGAEHGALLGQAGVAVEVGERLADGGGEVAAVEVPLAGDGAAGNDLGNAVRGRSAEEVEFRIAQLAVADLDGVDVHVTALVVVAIAEEHGVGQEGAAGIVQTLVGGPVILLDAVDVLGDDRGIGRLVIGGRNAVPGSGGEGSSAVVAVAALAEVAALPEQVAVIALGVVGRADLQQRGRARTRGADEDVEDDGVLVHTGSAAVRLDAMIHDQADLALEIAGDLDDFGILAADQIHAERRAGAKHRALLGQAVRAVEVGEGLADGGREIAAVEVPLAGHLGAGAGADDDVEGPAVGAGGARGVGVL